jgi:predicted transcriptional regulator
VIYRSKTEIIAVILQTVSAGSSITKIMYNAYLSYTLVRKYLGFLMENDMIRYEGKSHLYKITEKGKRFLQTYEEINKMIGSKMKNVRAGD